jgi:hypothetical protein
MTRLIVPPAMSKAERIAPREGNPFGIVSLDSSLISLQPYDISIVLTLPRSPPNLRIGNFMLDVTLLSPTSPMVLATAIPSSATQKPSPIAPDVLGYSRRPAILTYESQLIDTTKRLAALPWYLLGWRREAETLKIKMMEDLEFRKGWKNVPSAVRVELQPKGEIEIYDVRLKVEARFKGMR